MPRRAVESVQKCLNFIAPNPLQLKMNEHEILSIFFILVLQMIIHDYTFECGRSKIGMLHAHDLDVWMQAKHAPSMAPLSGPRRHRMYSLARTTGSACCFELVR